MRNLINFLRGRSLIIYQFDYLAFFCVGKISFFAKVARPRRVRRPDTGPIRRKAAMKYFFCSAKSVH